jgi:hypothetical protein
MMMGSGFPQGCEKRLRLEKQVLSVLLEGKNTKDLQVFRPFRETKGSFPWPRHHRKVGANTTTPGTHPGDKESEKAHRVFCHHGHAPLVPITLRLNVCTPASCIRGRLEDAIACHIHRVVEGAVACHIRGRVEGAICSTVSRGVDRPIAGSLFIPTFFARSITCGTG